MRGCGWDRWILPLRTYLAILETWSAPRFRDPESIISSPGTAAPTLKSFEINAETGENLGRLNLLYLKKPIPCYYLVYVEVATPFRNQGLGNRILSAFRSFLIQKSAVGILDNIIPEDDPTYDIYVKLDWKPIQSVTGLESIGDGVYMIFIPPAMGGKDIKDGVIKLLHHLKRKRASIDMRDNEQMVKRTIEEFKDLYSALITYFERAEPGRENELLKRFMFTRFVTKLLGFRRRIAELLGYTGGESLEQIVLHEEIRSLNIQSVRSKGSVGRVFFPIRRQGIVAQSPGRVEE